jgi:peptidoglycan/xylan/chitin deacetylase (PgdA/CDA1 family)
VKPWQPSVFLKISAAVHAGALVFFLFSPQQWPLALGIVLLNHAAIAAVGLWPRSRWLGPNWIRLPAATLSGNEIAITIDDGPHPEVTPLVLDILDAYNATATFFCIGTQAQRYPQLCREIVQRGHAVENHSHRHRHDFSLRGYRACQREVDAGQVALTAITGRAPRFFRAPAGLRNPFLDAVLAHSNLQLAAWTRRGFDTRSGDAALVLKRLLHNLQGGDILLLHDGNSAYTNNGKPVIVAVLPQLLAALAARGLTTITLPAALERISATPLR